MGLAVFYKEDVINAILAAEQAARATARGDSTEFLEGYRAALTTIALAFGLGSDNDRMGLPSLVKGNDRMLALLVGRGR